jgi:hypothetical protein
VLSHRESIRDAPRSLDLVGMTLTVPKSQGVNGIPFGRCQGEQRGGIEPTAEEKNR